MKKIFYFGLLSAALFEVVNVYFIMPMPGSQEINSINIAYFLYTYRWVFRIILAVAILVGAKSAFEVTRVWIPVAAIALFAVVVYAFNFKMVADHMFRAPETLSFQGKSNHALNDSSVVIAITHKGNAKAYPVRYIVYHHQVRDSIADKQVMITYCSVCRTGRVYEPTVKGQLENFRLVGMDHFNAMFEDETTGTWWRQVTGEAIAGSLKGERLPEFESSQMTLGKFFTTYPFGQVMNAEEISKERYDSLGKFEKGRSKGDLTKTDSLSWKDKSWVVGVVVDHQTKAYDWNALKASRVIHDNVGNTPVLVALADDNQSFAVFAREQKQVFTIRNDSLISDNNKYSFAGEGAGILPLKKLQSFQEFWHSWKTFHPDTKTYPE